FPEDQKPWPQMTFFVRAQSTMPSVGFVDAIRRAFRETAPTMPVPDITPLASNVDIALAPQRFTASVLTGFAAVALLLASIGLFGVVSFSVPQRVPGIGLRLALRARPGRVMRPRTPGG